MKPSSSRYSNYNDYDAQGMIVHELRKIAQNYKLPVMSITQNTRGSENASQALGNSLVGDSLKKVRFSDYIYMIRMRADLDLLSASVKHDIMDTDDDDDDDDNQLSMTDMTGQYVQNLLAFEVQITKAKEGKKDAGKFHIFCGLNLNIYNTLAEFYADLPTIIKNNKELEDQISILDMQQRQQIEVQDTINATPSLI